MNRKIIDILKNVSGKRRSLSTDERSYIEVVGRAFQLLDGPARAVLLKHEGLDDESLEMADLVLEEDVCLCIARSFGTTIKAPVIGAPTLSPEERGEAPMIEIWRKS